MGVGAHRGEEAAGLAEHDREALALIAGLGEVAKAAGHAGPEPGPCEAARPRKSLFGASDLMKMVHSIEVPFPSQLRLCMCAANSAGVQPAYTLA